MTKPSLSPLPPVTTALIVACLGTALWSGLLWSLIGIDPDRVETIIFRIRPLLLTEVFPDTGILAVVNGDYWRLLAPVLLHFGIAHIVFNMLWLWQLGGPLERRLGSLELFLLITVVGALSNLAQYFYDPFTMFGGMSGVVYALLGYFWMQGRFNTRFGMALRQPIVVMMLIWFVVCWLGLVGNIANMAHTAGLLLGTMWGFASATLAHPK
ncbi:rhomboid family intramembrane serine protease [Pseudomonadota bacterium]